MYILNEIDTQQQQSSVVLLCLNIFLFLLLKSLYKVFALREFSKAHMNIKPSAENSIINDKCSVQKYHLIVIACETNHAQQVIVTSSTFDSSVACLSSNSYSSQLFVVRQHGWLHVIIQLVKYIFSTYTLTCNVKLVNMYYAQQTTSRVRFSINE